MQLLGSCAPYLLPKTLPTEVDAGPSAAAGPEDDLSALLPPDPEAPWDGTEAAAPARTVRIAEEPQYSELIRDEELEEWAQARARAQEKSFQAKRKAQVARPALRKVGRKVITDSMLQVAACRTAFSPWVVDACRGLQMSGCQEGNAANVSSGIDVPPPSHLLPPPPPPHSHPQPTSLCGPPTQDGGRNSTCTPPPPHQLNKQFFPSLNCCPQVVVFWY